MGRTNGAVGRSPIIPDSTEGPPNVNISLSLGPIVSLIAGVLILVMPRLLNYIVALYLIVIGLIGLFGGAVSAGSVHL